MCSAAEATHLSGHLQLLPAGYRCRGRYGFYMGLSAWMQGKAAARASDALAETGKGFGNYIMVLGVIETVALFVMVFAMIALPKA